MLGGMRWPEPLFDTLDRRAMPEQVAALILDSLGGTPSGWAGDDLRLLTRVARARGGVSLSSMPDDWERPPDCARHVATALAVYGIRDCAAAWQGDPASRPDINALIGQLGSLAGSWLPGMDWKDDRHTARQRARLVAANPGAFPALEKPGGGTVGHRRYNKLIRVLRNLDENAAAMEQAQAFRRIILISRSGFASDIPRARFCTDPDAAAFIAWMVARKNRRRQFTLAGRENPFDEVAAMLLARCERAETCDWPMIAAVWHSRTVLARCQDYDLGQMAARWWAVMRDCSVMLAAAWPGEGPWQDGKVTRSEMVVARGMDSYRWNMLAGAFNAARAGWIGCLTAGGNAPLLAPCLPGKVMRLMAYDLWRWHQASGGQAHPDTAVWASLPYPWDVIAGLDDCTLDLVDEACRACGVSPEASGWTVPLLPGAVAAFTPTPELVHGVQVADPAWAGLLRKAGVFSGKRASGDAAELRAAAEEQGMVTGPLPSYAADGTYLGQAGGG